MSYKNYKYLRDAELTKMLKDSKVVYKSTYGYYNVGLVRRAYLKVFDNGHVMGAVALLDNNSPNLKVMLHKCLSDNLDEKVRLYLNSKEKEGIKLWEEN